MIHRFRWVPEEKCYGVGREDKGRGGGGREKKRGREKWYLWVRLLLRQWFFRQLFNPQTRKLSPTYLKRYQRNEYTGEDGKPARIQRPKSRKAESCTVKCVTTCIRGGAGSPGEGPLNARRPLVVFKEGFRSRQYCLVECSDICNLIKDGDDGP
ncbi:uncharacterized protein LOC131256556 isoform X1 [Magnolia sinica]|uniref:uncharacterized protein LOC131256556 isoform X1 n=1 Tax=Magnolia sinica TaxID=86752 RepID=UPI00265876F0|nr:uncharacterized protein LOC131256556 isoform X1 [Magnolia sinica]